ncbi:iron complex outermembrane receptor protein [Novosphingobium chloroacetimidivorans]|uniref:Iron complex outermembrane receptor protein n=1 Tax=Novosphingobium chloroacetimidivorans TaxID=1428314 RepID=A0A7W7K6S1_9SPHN|nr:TonB-dependent receptor [Novosphingobium chloroacetimidivorans]MBB4857290.1 iron complex outermembrane receptor protein [Novosphingobium chloroacetimidivorans]
MRSSRSRVRVHALAGAGVLAVAMPTLAWAQQDPASQTSSLDTEGLEAIVVTAQRRQEDVQDVPIAVSAVSAATLDEAGIDVSRDLPQVIPSVQFSRSGASGLFFVRGVGTTNAAVGEEGANAFYVDGVYLGDLAQTINNFNNVERIEVLKGPQGTLFGRNATGGLIHVITRDPGDEVEMHGQFGYANYQTVDAKLYLATPLVEDKLGVDLAVTYRNQDKGWGRNLTLNREIHTENYWGARSKLVAKPTDTIKLTLAGDYYKNRDNLGVAWKIKPGTVGTGGFPGVEGQDSTSDQIPVTRQKVYGTSLTGEFDLGFATLTNVAAYRKARNASDFDVDGGPRNLIRITFVSTSRTIQEELRLSSNGTGALQWQAGFFYLNSKASNDSDFTGLAFSGSGVARQEIRADLKTNSYAGFGELTWKVTDTTQLTGGLRYTADRREFDGTSTNVLLNGTRLPPATQPIPRLKYNEWTYRVALRQDLTDGVNLYASVNRGFKAGSYSLQSPANAPFLPQTIMAYELGLKSELFNRKLRVNLAGFHYDIDDFQVRSAAVATPGANLILNAATVKVDGVEMEFEAAPADGLRLFGGATYLKSRFSKFGGPGADFQAPIVYPNPASCPAARFGTEDPGLLGPGPRTGGFLTCFGDVSGNRTPNSPKFAASLGASYTMPVGDTGKLQVTGLYSYNDGYYFEPDNVHRQGSYSLVNGSIEYRPTQTFGIALWGKNLFDKEYAIQDLTTATGVTEALGTPRTYGVDLKFDF